MSIINDTDYRALAKKGAQAIFDHVVEHLNEQREISIKGDRCQYRGPNGLSCSVGCVIPNSLYREWFEAYPSITLWARLAHLEDYRVLSNNSNLLNRLQVFHDYYYIQKPPIDQYEDLKDIAKSFGLEMNISLATIKAWGFGSFMI